MAFNEFNTNKIKTVEQQSPPPTRNNGVIIGRVLSVELNDPKNLGQIQYQSLYTQTTTKGFALPANQNIKQYPTKDEIVAIIIGPSNGLNESPNRQEAFYLPAFSLWSNSHQNRFPDLSQLNAEVLSQQSQVETTQQGIERTPGTVFLKELDTPERLDITTLQPFPGDITIESRWGSSMRLGSTNKGGSNPWSTGKVGNLGDPILIISNGYVNNGEEPWNTVVEDANTDLASIWMTSTQEVRIRDIEKNCNIGSFTARARTTQKLYRQERRKDDNLSASQKDKLDTSR
jgi:hypothetical protein